MIIKTDDGYTFYILEDGRVTDSLEEDEDMSWDNIQDFIESQGLPLTLTIHHFNTKNKIDPNTGKPYEVGVGW